MKTPLDDREAAPPFVASVTALKHRIETEARLAVDEFHRETGLTPRGIYVEMVEMTTVGDRLRRYAVNEVTVRIEV